MNEAIEGLVLPLVPSKYKDAVFGQLAWLQLGDGSPMSTVSFGRTLAGERVLDADLFPNYCAGRMMLLGELALLTAAGRCDWTGLVRELLPWYGDSWVGNLTLADVALHRRGLHRVNGVLARLVDRATLRDLIANPPEDDGPVDEPMYSDYAAGHILGEVIEVLSGVTYVEHVCGSQTPVPFPAEFGSNLRDLKVNAHADLRLGRPVAALGDVAPSATGRWNPAFGWYGSARALVARLAGNLGAIADVTDLAPLVETQGRNVWETSLQRPLAVSLLGCAEWFGTSVVGLSGQGGISFCGYDLGSRRVFAWNISPALDTPAALARSAALIDLLQNAPTS